MLNPLVLHYPFNLELILHRFNQRLLRLYFSVASSTYHKSEKEIHAEYEVIKNCQRNPEYFAPIYRKYYDQIYLFVYKRVDHLDITADITSRIFLKCLKNIGKYKYQGVPFSAWLYRIAINEVNTFFRQQKKLERTVNIDDQHIGTFISELDYSEPQIDPHVLVPVLLEQLSEYEVQFIELRFFEGHTFKEMGYLLGLTEINAKIRTYRILKKLKKIAAEIKYN